MLKQWSVGEQVHVFIILQLQISSCSGSVRIRRCFIPSAFESSSSPVLRILLRKLCVPFQKLQNRIRAQVAIWFSICLGVLDMRREMNAHCAFYCYNHMALGKQIFLLDWNACHGLCASGLNRIIWTHEQECNAVLLRRRVGLVASGESFQINEVGKNPIEWICSRKLDWTAIKLPGRGFVSTVPS